MNELLLKLQGTLSKSGKFTPSKNKFNYAELAKRLKDNPDTPVETGELKNSYSGEALDDGVRVTYDVEYANRVYYDPEITHHTGTGRWLENAWTKDRIAEIIKKQIKE